MATINDNVTLILNMLQKKELLLDYIMYFCLKCLMH